MKFSFLPVHQKLVPAGHLLFRPGFLLGLGLLILNDWWWKDAYPGFLTGKISDLAGLFILPIFLSAFWPRHLRWHLGVTALLFCWWNAPLSQGFIDWGQGMGIPFHRTSDPTDYLALFILPLAASYIQQRPEKKSFRFSKFSPALAVLGFVFLTATSVRPQFGTLVEKTYQINLSNQELLDELAGWDAVLLPDSTTDEPGAYFLHHLKWEGEEVLGMAQFVLTEKEGKSQVYLKEVTGVEPIYPFFIWQNGSQFKRQAKRYLIKELKQAAKN